MTDRVTLAHPDLPPGQTITKPNDERTLAHYRAIGWKPVRSPSATNDETATRTTSKTARRTTKE